MTFSNVSTLGIATSDGTMKHGNVTRYTIMILLIIIITILCALIKPITWCYYGYLSLDKSWLTRLAPSILTTALVVTLGKHSVFAVDLFTVNVANQIAGNKTHLHGEVQVNVHDRDKHASGHDICEHVDRNMEAVEPCRVALIRVTNSFNMDMTVVTFMLQYGNDVVIICIQQDHVIHTFLHETNAYLR